MGAPRVSLERRLADLGWGGVPLVTAFTNVVWQYLSAGLDVTVPLRLIEDDGVLTGERAMACCTRALAGMFGRG